MCDLAVMHNTLARHLLDRPPLSKLTPAEVFSVCVCSSNVVVFATGGEKSDGLAHEESALHRTTIVHPRQGLSQVLSVSLQQ